MREQDFNLALTTATASPHDRFAIYRNNVSGALRQALRVRFPVVEQLVGPDFFNGIAGEYCSLRKPASAVLIQYGASFSDFLAAHEAASELPYLAEVAQFENAWWHSYHAADSTVFDQQELNSLAPEAWGSLRFKFQPAVQFFEAKHGAVSIWQWHQTTNNPNVLTIPEIEFALISRSAMDVEVRMISADGFLFLKQLWAGHSLEIAVAETQAQFPTFELQNHLTALFQLHLISGIIK